MAKQNVTPNCKFIPLRSFQINDTFGRPFIHKGIWCAKIKLAGKAISGELNQICIAEIDWDDNGFSEYQILHPLNLFFIAKGGMLSLGMAEKGSKRPVLISVMIYQVSG